MKQRTCFVLLAVGILLQGPAQAQSTLLGLGSYFEEAYWRYPNVPAGMLEAMAYSASRFTNLQPSLHDADNCTGMPLRYGLYALVENGKGYFKNNLLTVCQTGGITVDQYNNDVRLQVLAVAKYLSREASFKQPDVRISAEGFAEVLDKLAEFPNDSSVVNQYALALYKYDIYDQLQRGINTPVLKRAPVKVQLDQVFPAPLLQTLQAAVVELNDSTGGPHIQTADNNFENGRNGTPVTHVAIHTAQGSYAGAISWFKNPAAHRSTHYIVRASDGQITQLVKESDRALHAQSADAYSIGIAHEGYIEYGHSWYTDKLYVASAALVRSICSRNGIDATTCYRGLPTNNSNAQSGAVHIKGHQHYSGHSQTDPGQYWNWNKYADLVAGKEIITSEKEPSFVTINNGVYRIVNVNSKKVLHTRDCSGKSLSYVTQTTWDGKACQRWRFEYAGEGWYKITSLVSGRALEVPGGSKQPVQLQIKDARENDNQLWRLLEAGDNGELRLVNKASSKTVEVFSGSAKNGAAVLQTAFTGKTRQLWLLNPVHAEEESEAHRFRQVQLDSVVVER